MKKVLAALAALLIMTVCLAGCNNDPLSSSGGSSSDADSNSIVSKDNKNYENNIDGLEEFLNDHGYINISDDRSNVTETDASQLGAVAGRRYESTINNAVIFVEIYEYDVNSSNETAQKVKSSVTTSGQFQILDLEPTKAYLNGSGKFLMTYNDTTNPEEGTENYARMTNTIEAFKSFNA